MTGTDAASDDEIVAVATASGGGFEVIGAGPLAERLRERLPAGGDPQPTTVVLASSEPAALAEALARVADLGTVVLAADPTGGTVELDLYADLHTRGLTLVGVPSPSASAAADG